MEQQTIPGHTRLLPDFMLTGRDGRPFVFAKATGGIGYDAARLDWTGSLWTERWRLGTGTDYLKPMFGPDQRLGLVWTSHEFEIKGLGSRHWVLTAEDFGTSVAAPETVGHMPSHAFTYGGTMSARRRWAAFPGRPLLNDRTVTLQYSDTVGIWRNIPVPGAVDGGVNMAAIDDTTALLAWAEDQYPGGIRWGVVRGGV